MSRNPVTDPPRAISVHQPYAWLIVNGVKDVENRRNPPLESQVGRRVYIHASGGRVTQAAFEEFLADIKGMGLRGVPKSVDDFEYGAIIGSVVVTGSTRSSRSNWAIRGRCHWLLRDARKMAPKRMKGQQCLFWKVAL